MDLCPNQRTKLANLNSRPDISESGISGNGGQQCALSEGVNIQVLLGVVLGAALGYFWPTLAVRRQPFGDAFIELVRMITAPIVFVTVLGSRG